MAEVPIQAESGNAGATGSCRANRFDADAIRGDAMPTSGGCSTWRSRGPATGCRSPRTARERAAALRLRRTSSSADELVGERRPPDQRGAATGRDARSRRDLQRARGVHELPPSSFLLRNELGFMPPAKTELGYGHAVHHLMRVIAEQVKAMVCCRRRDLSTTFSPRASTCRSQISRRIGDEEKRPHGRSRSTSAITLTTFCGRGLPNARSSSTSRAVVMSGRADVIHDDMMGPGEPCHRRLQDFDRRRGRTAPAPGLCRCRPT